MHEFAKILILSGLVLVFAGVLVLVVGKVPNIGRLPGDILVRKENYTFYFPLATSILFSLVLSLILYFINRR